VAQLLALIGLFAALVSVRERETPPESEAPTQQLPPVEVSKGRTEPT
jgi:arabinofuranan 3-O-arabinosyltransferase